MGFIDRVLGVFGLQKIDKETIAAGTIEKEFGVQPTASRKMEDNVNLWWSMYVNRPPWETHDIRPLGLPGAIGRELSRHALTEFSVAVTGSARADYINEQIQRAAEKFPGNLELGLCLGGLALKPYPENGRVLVGAFTTAFTPTRFDGEGKAIGGVFKSAPVRMGNDWYIKLEYHDFQTRQDGSTVYVVENKAFRSGREGGVGASVPLNTVPQWAQLEEHIEIENLEGPLFAYFKPPTSNDIEPSSPLGVSVYAGPTVDLIKQADEQWEKLRWTFDVAEPKIFADGTLDHSQVSDRVFVHGAFTGEGKLFEIFDPEVKDSAYYRGFQYILQRIEYNTGLAFGTISDPQSVEKTATEILAAKQRQFVTEKGIQNAFQAALDGLIYAVNALCDLYSLAPAGAYETAYQWGDGVLDDPDTRRQDMAMGVQLMNSGIMGPVEYRMKYFGENEETAKAMLPTVDALADEDEGEIE